MNNIVKVLSELSVTYVQRTFAVLDKILSITSSVFTDVEIRYNQTTSCFEFKVDDVVAVIARDLNRFVITITVMQAKDESIVAKYEIAPSNGTFTENYTNFHNTETKYKFVNLFAAISNIDLDKLNDLSEDIKSEEAEDKDKETEKSSVDETNNDEEKCVD